MRSTPPIHSSRSGLTGFLTSTGMSWPRSASAISCMAKGLAVVRAPIQIMSMPPSSAAMTCLRVATSVAVYIPVSRFTRWSHATPSAPTPSNPPGLVRGFQSPARKIRTPSAASSRAVSITCSSVSALHGPAMTSGRRGSSPGKLMGCKSFISVLFELLSFVLSLSFRVIRSLPPRLRLCPRPPRKSGPMSFRSDFGIGIFGIFAQNPEIAGQRPGRIDRLPVPHRVVEGHVHVKPVFPFASDDRQRLYFREVDSVEG